MRPRCSSPVTAFGRDRENFLQLVVVGVPLEAGFSLPLAVGEEVAMARSRLLLSVAPLAEIVVRARQAVVPGTREVLRAAGIEVDPRHIVGTDSVGMDQVQKRPFGWFPIGPFETGRVGLNRHRQVARLIRRFDVLSQHTSAPTQRGLALN